MYNASVLCVDRDSAVLQDFCATVEDAGHTALVAHSLIDALQIIAYTPVDLAFVSAPADIAARFAADAKQLQSDIVILLRSDTAGVCRPGLQTAVDAVVQRTITPELLKWHLDARRRQARRAAAAASARSDGTRSRSA